MVQGREFVYTGSAETPSLLSFMPKPQTSKRRPIEISRFHKEGPSDINEQRQVRSHRIAKNNVVTTTGEMFADGTIIEMISGSDTQPRLLLYSGDAEAKSGARVEYAGQLYEAPRLDAGLLRATRLPQAFSGYDSLRNLVTKIADQFRRRQNFAEPESKLLAAFSIATWVSDRLPLAPSLVVFGPEMAINALRLLNCFCRRPLMLGALNPATLRNLPIDFHFTLLLHRPAMTKRMQQLLETSAHKGVYIFGNGGRLLDLFSPRAILSITDEIGDLGDHSIQVSVEQSQISHAIDTKVQYAISEEFQPQLLMYRLKNCEKIQVRAADVPEFAVSTRQLADNLAACFSEDLELAHELVSLLGRQDEELHNKQSTDIRSAVLTILLATIHEGKMKQIQVEKIATLANALQRSWGRTLEYSAEELGWKLKEFGIQRHRTNSGSVIILDSETSHQIHRLARISGLLKIASGRDCQECTRVESVTPK